MIAQIAIAFTGVMAIYLSQDTKATRRAWAPVFGLLGQPFWFYAAYTAEQWGIFFLGTLYAWSWYRGFRTNTAYYKARAKVLVCSVFLFSLVSANSIKNKVNLMVFGNPET